MSVFDGRGKSKRRAMNGIALLGPTPSLCQSDVIEVTVSRTLDEPTVMEGRNTFVPGLTAGAILLTGLALSIGWGVRGNWGHEYGAMIPGALAAIAAYVTSGREDWRRRTVDAAFFGALGWSFGGSMSYMIVISYTHSGHFESMLYGHACLFLLGFLWAAPGGVGTAMPTAYDRSSLDAFYLPAFTVMAAWMLEYPALVGLSRLFSLEPYSFNWFDTDWIAAAIALVVSLLFVLISPSHRRAAALYLLMSVGWWAGFLGLVVFGGLRMTPPRGDNWAGMVGLTLGMFLYLAFARQPRLIFAGLMAGFWGGLGFSGGNTLKLLEIGLGEYLVKAGVWTSNSVNWHSVLEQSFGFISGVGIAVTMGMLSTRSPRQLEETSAKKPWTSGAGVAFVLLAITFVNIRKNFSSTWFPNKVVPERLYQIPAETWFNFFYGVVALVVLAVIARHRRKPIAAFALSSLGQSQLLFLALLWWIVVGNAVRVFPFPEGRLVTEGVIQFNASLATLLVLVGPWDRGETTTRVSSRPIRSSGLLLAGTLIVGLVFAAGSIAAETWTINALFGDQPLTHARRHIRFGPENTNDPSKDLPRPDLRPNPKPEPAKAKQ